MCKNESAENSRINRIRESEARSRTEIYTKEKLYETDTWLKKPVKTVVELMNAFSDYYGLRVLDLGCGIGRNSVFIAETFKGRECIKKATTVIDWPDLDSETMKKVKKKIDTGWNIHLKED